MKRTKDKRNKKQPEPDYRWWLDRARGARRAGQNTANTYVVDAEDLWAAACEYFEWVQNNPLYSTHTFKIRNEVITQEVPYDRPFTKYGLFIYLGIAQRTWVEWRNDEELSDTVQLIDQVITTQKYEGAVSGIFNPMIIARDLGLKEGSEVSGPGGGPIETDNTEHKESKEPDPSQLSDDALNELVSVVDGKNNGNSTN